ncbi:sulfatase-like hydrolase/transferase [Solibacillus sp. A46]|uniref:Sulfatase-like hydrolase/transferase n=1 Tax=Solibacillus faecavium TaxID=2762221 RepID=A0ABR8XUT2_9BACL|nr:sulfatase-like hydrolase/transferase [Solibacillus faecavium]MBD8035703.1 sulfatase-like hydrolase/transferase [Solibacillus faecavium]
MKHKIIQIKMLHTKLQDFNHCEDVLGVINKLGSIAKTETYYIAKSTYLFNAERNKEARKIIHEGLLKFSYSYGLHFNAVFNYFKLNDFGKVFEHLGQCYIYATDEGHKELDGILQEILSEINSNNLIPISELEMLVEQLKKVINQTDGRMYPIDRYGDSLIRKVLDKGTKYENLTNLYKTLLINDINSLIRYYVKSERFMGREGLDFNFEFNQKTMIPVSLMSNDTKVTFKWNGEEYKDAKLNLTQYNYLNFDKGKLTITSDKPIFVGKPIKCEDELKPQKLVMHIFIDGLSGTFLEENNPSLLIPNIKKSFVNIYENKNCYAAADWTFPSNAATVTATDFTKHGQYHPTFNHDFSIKRKSLIETIRENGYFTTSIGGDWRGTPIQGYGKSYDRVVFKNSVGGFGVSEIIEEVIDHLEAFEDKNNYIWITIPDLHDVADEIYFSPLSQMKLGFQERISSNMGATSVQTDYSEAKVNRYSKELNRIDLHLGVLFDYLKKKYSEDEMLIIVHSDHGQKYLSNNEKHFLNDYRTKVPFFLMGAGIENKISETLMSNLDIYPTVLKLLNIQNEQLNLDGGILKDFGGEHREFAIAETIHPNQVYQIAFNFEWGTIHFKTKELVDSVGMVEFENYSFDINSKKEISDELKNDSMETVMSWIENNRLHLQK